MAIGGMKHFLKNTILAWPIGVGLFAVAFCCMFAVSGHSGNHSVLIERVGLFLLLPSRLFPDSHPGSLRSTFLIFLETSLGWAVLISVAKSIFGMIRAKRRKEPIPATAEPNGKMKTPRPCVMLWLAREGTSAERNEAYHRLRAEVKLPKGRSMTISGEEEELVSVDEMIDGMPLDDRYADAAIAAAKKKGLDRVAFIAAIYFRDVGDAPSTSKDIFPVHFVGRFEFPFPERGDFIPRDEHEWLGIDGAYCLDEGEKRGNDDGYIGHF